MHQGTWIFSLVGLTGLGVQLGLFVRKLRGA